jgi:predicted permease
VLGRSVSRRREIATRLALGSGRLRLIRQLVTESLVLSILGGALGIALAHAGVAYFNSLGAAIRFQMSGLERAAFSSIRLDTGTMVFCAVVVSVIPLLVGLLPAVGGSRLSLVGALKTGTASGSLKGTKGRGTLLITQIALAFTLLVGSGLLLRTIGRLNQNDIGFDTAAMMTARIALPSSRYDRPASEAFFTGLLERVRALPGVHSATFINCVPFAVRCRNGSRVATLDGLEIEPDRSRAIGLNFVAPGYFRSTGVPVLRGRSFTTLDGIDTPTVVVIGRETAGWLWPNEDPVGRSLSLLGTADATVIGVVDDVRYDKVDELSRPDIYVSTLQFPRREGYIVTRHSAESASHILAIREVVHGLDSDLPLFDIQAMTDRANDATWRTRFSGVLISLFAFMTLILSAIGIYGLLSYSVERKAHDIGIMMALGATQKTALKSVVGSALLLAGGGIGLGILVAIALTRFLQAMLFETSPHDPSTYSAAAVLFVAVSLAASYFPARRASSVDPVKVLKAE